MAARAQQPRRVVITGASSGIGAALARHYAAAGAIYPIDVRDTTALSACARDFIARHGCPDLVIASAGVSLGTLTEHAEDIAAFQDVFDINVMGMVKAFQPFVRCMRERASGTLVGIASVAGYRGLPGGAAYSASKAAAIAYLESLRVELAPSGIKVVTICPGYIATPMTEGNTFPMPFLLSAEDAAARIARIVARGRKFAVIPWQMAIVARLLHVLPDWLYDGLFARAPRKPRREA